ncbi:MAG: hypothetical protein NWE93_09590 [Candidatus Bathyarchaeota archaeon]|nr:hypothetical protein [Candidatus Bathyarchaeota archaeon]
MPTTVRYHFRQHLQAPPKAAFEWCTDFSPEDQMLMDCKDSERAVTKLSEGTVVLRDTFHTSEGIVEKQKLVSLYPELHSWVSTHLTGPNRYSQFLYQISPDGKGGSYLDFWALHLEYDCRGDVGALADKLCQEDHAAWRLLAAALSKELSGPS